MSPTNTFGVGMDPQRPMNDGSPYNLAEIWSFTINGGGIAVPSEGGCMELRNDLFGPGLGRFGSSRSSANSNRDVSMEDSIGVDQARSKQGGDLAKIVSTDGGNGMNACSSQRLKTKKSGDEIRDSMFEGDASSGKGVEQNPQPLEPWKQDYIHVRARRGQATDNHSLAERARREKISERMKTLQNLVPGCDKVVGKAVVLDEIINYIQSLQHQVEFLSVKLEAVNSWITPEVDAFSSSVFGQQAIDGAGSSFPMQASYGDNETPY